MLKKYIFILSIMILIAMTSCAYLAENTVKNDIQINNDTVPVIRMREIPIRRGSFTSILRNTQEIQEYMIPMPEVQYELPETLIGEFVMISRFANIEITIFPNNKYILLLMIPGHMLFEYFGYIIYSDNRWYFSPTPATGHNLGTYFRDFTEIHLTDTGFSFSVWDHGYFRSIRKENIPTSENRIIDISATSRTSKQQYFIFNDSIIEKIDLSEIEVVILENLLYWRHHQLKINHGFVEIMPFFAPSGGSIVFRNEGVIYEGFIEKTEATANSFKGIIRFTNGVPFYYISDGTAEIEMKNDGSIIISMLYTPNSIYMSELAKGLSFPARLILEF